MNGRDRQPWCRASVRGGEITLNRWTSWLASGGFGGPAVGGLQAALVDLHGGADHDELIVSRVPGSSLDDRDEATLLDWALRVGYRRVWLPDRVVTTENSALDGGVVSVVCPTCGACWRNEVPEFWLGVRSARCFPGSCMACGGSLPEWTPPDAEPVASAAERDELVIPAADPASSGSER